MPDAGPSDDDTATVGEAKSGYVSVDGARLHYRIDGPHDAPTVVLSNSLGLDARMWEPQVPAFAERFRVIRYDSRGHGRSDAPPGPYTLDLLGGDLLSLLDALAIERAHVCGLSLGGMVALWLAIHHPERVLRAVFTNTAARIGTMASWSERIRTVTDGGMEAIRDGVVARFLSPLYRERRPEVARWVGDMLAATSPHGYIATCDALRGADLRSVVTRIQAPSLIVAGELDEATPPAQLWELHALIAGSELRVLQESAHLSNVEQSATFNESVLEFLRRT